MDHGLKLEKMVILCNTVFDLIWLYDFAYTETQLENPVRDFLRPTVLTMYMFKDDSCLMPSHVNFWMLGTESDIFYAEKAGVLTQSDEFELKCCR